MDMDVSVIIVNYHSAALVVDCIKSIQKQTQELEYEIIVVDNASGDGSVELLEKSFDGSVRLIASEQNLGFGKANNLGARRAQGKYLFLLNPDTILVNNAVKILYDALESDSSLGVVGGNLYTPEMTPAPSYCERFDDLALEKERASWRCLLHNKLRPGCSRPFEDSFNYGSIPKPVAYIFGADMMLSRELFQKLGGFDPEFFMYAEEEDLSWRITGNGHRIMNIPQAKIIHMEGATVKQANAFSERQFRMRMNGTLTYFKKRFGMEGTAEFVRLRTKRYQRQILMGKLRGHAGAQYAPVIQCRCLQEVYEDFLKVNSRTGEKDHG